MTGRCWRDDHVWMLRRVLIVDDHVGFRTVARVMLQSEGFEVVGQAADGGDALAPAQALHRPTDGAVELVAVTAALVDAARDHGATVRFGATVTPLASA